MLIYDMYIITHYSVTETNKKQKKNKEGIDCQSQGYNEL